jgi:hypothetical protein
MVVQRNPTVFRCGRGVLPGTQGPGGGGNGGVLTPIVVTPRPSDPKPPFLPVPPPSNPKVKCVEMSDGPLGWPPQGFFPLNPPYRECRPCDGALTGKNYGPAKNPSPNDPGCVFASVAQCTPLCVNPLGKITEGGDVVPPPPSITGGGSPAGQLTPASPGGTTGNVQYYKCAFVSATVCPGQENLPLNEATILTVTNACEPCSPTFINSNGEVVPDPTCVYSSLTLCQTSPACPPTVQVNPPSICPPTGPTTGGPGTTQGPTTGTERQITERDFEIMGRDLGIRTTTTPSQPSISARVSTQSNQIVDGQQTMNATVIRSNELLEEEDYQNNQRSVSEPVLFDPLYNFYKFSSNELISEVPNNKYLKVFKTEVTEEIAELLSNRESLNPWNEKTLQNLSDNQLLTSLNSKLVNSFQYLRHIGGKPIGVSTLLGVIRKHLLEGTIDEFDPNFYIEAAQNQFSQKFEVFEVPEQKEQAERLAIQYLKNNLYTYVNDKSSNWRNFQINRVRPLNEDINIEIKATKLDGSVEDLRVPNEGVEVSKIVSVDQLTVPSVGSPDRLNIGDGGGYYIDASDLQQKGIAVPTANIIDKAFYAPPQVRTKVLDMLDVDPAITITASSVSSQNEFQSNDAGASAIKPLFFAINLSSVGGDYVSDSLIESYSASYSLLTASSDIQVHVNNNALNIPMLCLDYRDPLYRYILDTSAFTASLNDFNLNGFKDKGLSSIGSRFVRNIPFGFIVTPVAGGKYNPLNGKSTLKEYGDVHVRSIEVIPGIDATIDEENPPMLDFYSLNLEDGVDRVGIGEDEDTQNIGYRYSEDNFTQTFYSASANTYQTSSAPPSAQGTAYMLREVMDYLKTTYSNTSITWYDIYSRMPVTRVGEMFYDSDESLILNIANGFRGGVKVESIESNVNPTSRVIPDDSRTIISAENRLNLTKVGI